MTPNRQASTHRGEPPQRSHLAGHRSLSHIKRTPNGQARAQAPQLMQRSLSTEAIPVEGSTLMAPEGHASVQEGAEQWRHQRWECDPRKISRDTRMEAALLSWIPARARAHTASQERHPVHGIGSTVRWFTGGLPPAGGGRGQSSARTMTRSPSLKVITSVLTGFTVTEPGPSPDTGTSRYPMAVSPLSRAAATTVWKSRGTSVFT